jgi:hypothetical protein
MADYQRVVEYLRDVRQNQNGLPQQVTDELTRAAEEYAALCTTANDRLRQCSTFLQQGLRSEAIHLAEQPPNLLDLVAALDLPDPDAWTEYCQNNGLAVPPALQMDRATQLNEAYAQGAGLDDLLATHRRLALSRAPVRDRLAVVRQIAAADTSSNGAGGGWEKDVRLFEKARLKELPTAFHQAMREKDEARIHELMTEVHGSPWLEPVPADLAQAVSDADARFRRAAAEAELRPLVEPLREAFAAHDLPACRRLVAYWKQVIERHQTADLAASLVDEVKPVVAYIADEDKREAKLKRFRDACKAFGALLDRDAPDAELEPAWARLKAFEESLPPDLDQRYRDKKNARERAASRQHWMRLALAAAVIIVIGGAVVLGVVLFQQTQAAKAWARRIADADSRRDLATADHLVEQVKSHPELQNNADVLAAVNRTRLLHDEFNRQRAQVATLVDGLNAASDAAEQIMKQPDASDEQLATVSGQMQRASDQVTAAGGAGNLSWGDAEGKLATAMVRWTRVSKDLERTESAATEKEIGDLTASLERDTPDPAVDRAQLATVSDRLAAIRSWSGLNADAKAAAEQLGQKLAARQQAYAVEQNAAGAVESVRNQATSAASLAKALIDFTKRFPNDPRAADFKQAATYTAWGQAAEAWRRSDIGNPLPATTDGVPKKVDAVQAYLTSYPGTPLKAGLQNYVDWLKRFAAAVPDKSTAAPATAPAGPAEAPGSWNLALSDFFANPLLSQLQYMERSDGRRFYVMGDIKRQDLKIQDQTTIVFQALDPKDASKRVPVLVDPPLKLITETPQPAPHTKLVQALAQEINQIDPTNWETWGINAAERVRNAEDLDIVVRAVLLQRILKAELQIAGPEVGDIYGPTMASLEKQKPDDVPWLDPSAVPDTTKRALAAIFAAMPSADAAKAQIAKNRAAMLRIVKFDITGIGVLLKQSDQWTVVAKAPLPPTGVLYTVVPGEGASATGEVATTGPAAVPGALLQIGTVDQGKATVDATTASRAPQGSIVYILAP